MAARYLLPALAVAGRAAAQCAGSTTIQNAGDASALASCYTYSGSIAIATNTADDIALDGVRRITGSLTAKNVPNMTSLSGDSLQQIDDTFQLNNIQILSTLSFPSLTSVDTVVWEGLPNLQGLAFTSGLQEVSKLSIQNTELGTLEGIDLQQVDVFNVANNPYLNEITMQLGNVSNALSLEANGRDVRVSFPELTWAYNMTFRNCSSVNIQSLASLNGSLGFYSNYFSELSAPNLTLVGGGVAFVSNTALTSVSMPELKQINGGLQIANNTHLEDIDGFQRLARVGGAIDFNGEFSDVVLPDISDVRGAFNLQSTEDITKACKHFEPLSSANNVIKGPFTCVGEKQDPGGTGTVAPGTVSGASGGSSSQGAASTIYISGATAFMGVAAAIFGML